MRETGKNPLFEKLFDELEQLFSHVSEDIFRGKLRIPTMVIDTDRKVIFRFMPESYHMVIGGKFAKASLEEIQEGLLHEMVHIWNFNSVVTDCTSNSYHNKQFLDAALDAGLYVVRHKTKGWAITSFNPPTFETYRKPSAAMLKRRKLVFENSKQNWDVIKEGQIEVGALIESRGTKKVCFLKYECGCPPPHNSIRSGRRPTGSHPLNIRCMICGKEFVIAESRNLQNHPIELY